ncbi:hypothetical protein M427DRAFT_172427 [Gonapodya prolifera JEL478]|uniref:Uncharacterized protein n=1 Tax=Gonapodya prolifera (strain JEL478) TaxID=1344416 RepID=A0A139B0D6_GONPJ|nr:hypothetical protein M427DRAFT_172427 [Gonapodya prolifera JEL478]|eukprot:KXS22434.1 hypothetical protein M427DRAFT_172427 [Gonapodya prolifera JEL478]
MPVGRITSPRRTIQPRLSHDLPRRRRFLHPFSTLHLDSTNIEATAMEQRYQQEFREDERKIGRLISNLQNYSDPDNFSRYGTENGLSYASQLQTYIDNVVQKFGEDRERVRTVLGNARTELDAAYQSIQVYEDRTTEAERNKPTKLVSEINNYLPSLDEPIRKALSEKRCTYTVTGDRGTAQPYVVCSQGGCANAVICGSCYMSQTCHRDGIFKAHPVEFVYRVEYGDYVCSCGASGHCHSIPEKPAAPWPSLPAGADADVVEVAPFPPHIVVRSQPTVDRPIQIYDTKSIRIPVGIRSALQRFNAAASEFNDAFNQGHTTLLTAMLDTSGSTYRFSSTVNDAISKMENFQYRSVLGVLEDYPNDIISEILTAARSRVSSLAVSKKVLWHKILANFEMDVKVRETLTYMRRLIAEAKQDSDVSSARSKYLDVIQFARIRLDSEGTDSVVTLFNETLDAFNTSTEAYARELVEKTHFTPDWQFIERLPNQIEEDGKDAKRASMLKSWIAEAKVAYEKRVEEESLAKEKEAKEFAETRKKEIEEREKKLKAIYLEPYTGGAVRAGNDVWRYYSDGTLKSDSCEIRFNGSGFFPQSGISNGGYWNGETFTWSANWKDVLALDWNDKNGTFSPRYSEPLMTGSWRWDGAELIPSNEAYRSRVAAVEGSVPLPLVLFVAVSAWLRETLPRVNGDRLCRTHLWESDAGRHRQGKICRDCRKREHGSSHTCPIDGSKIYFPRNPAMTDGTHGDRCVRCGGLNDLIPAWLCDDCGRNFEKKCIYAR